MKTSKTIPAAPRARRVTPNTVMTPEEKEAFIAQTEEFEGPSRREIRRTERRVTHDPGVAPS